MGTSKNNILNVPRLYIRLQIDNPTKMVDLGKFLKHKIKV